MILNLVLIHIPYLNIWVCLGPNRRWNDATDCEKDGRQCPSGGWATVLHAWWTGSQLKWLAWDDAASMVGN